MPRAGHILQLIVLALLGVALVAVQSSGMSVAEGAAARSSVAGLLWNRHVLYALMAVVAVFVAGRADLRWLNAACGPVTRLQLLVGLSLLLVAVVLVPGVGRSVNGASRWLYLGPRRWGLSFQPSELVKWAMVLAIASWCGRRQGVMGRFSHGLMPPVIVLALGCGLIGIEDLGTAALIGLVGFCLLLAGGARVGHVAALLPPAALAVGALAVASPYRLARLSAFLDPWADPQGVGYHPIQSMLAISEGGLAGRGLGNGVQKFGYLPEDTTDFIYAVICEEMGLIGAVVVAVLYLGLMWWGFLVARRRVDLFSRLVVLGVMMTVGFQALINMAVVTVLVPTKGIALPLISAGGTGWVMTAAAIGLVASLDLKEEGGAAERVRLGAGLTPVRGAGQPLLGVR